MGVSRTVIYILQMHLIAAFSKGFYFSLWVGVGKGAILTLVSKEKIQKAKTLYAHG